ncbi:type III PLP-dependent enzyme [Parasedimentitalea huanghaiensis]|uniref:ornithine decarboxylase n=1 Tax=Parasedimentitalea huanghaiensis TaxID=2682100 RepID=A0A6L6WMM3_9RHOB|nr:type III PLP-dependent enzyme [Zongyanglinia huanghaiensis]MVO16892.1 type III PLP-dependent enzyme [Zongyanglinia huanghaiensis]
MQHIPALWHNPETHLARHLPDHPILYFSPRVLHQTAERFLSGFPGLVTYAVKANPHQAVLSNLVAAGVSAFDVASPGEMAAVRAASPTAVMHYNNPVRSEAEIQAGIDYAVSSWSVDELDELDKLADVPRSCEIAVRFALPVSGAAYDFGSKFGATPEKAVELLKQVEEMGWTPSLCFHPGTQCEDPHAWVKYIREAGQICKDAGVRIARLNVGGGFAANRDGVAPDLEQFFYAIADAVEESFGSDLPALICEPGRAMVSEAFTLAARIKGIRQEGEVVFLNDGIYGGLVDIRDMGLPGRVYVVAGDGIHRSAAAKPRVVFGPTCDSLDRLPDGLPLAQDTQVGDYVLFPGLGAYSSAMSTQFNGYGLSDVATVIELGGSGPDAR